MLKGKPKKRKKIQISSFRVLISYLVCNRPKAGHEKGEFSTASLFNGEMQPNSTLNCAKYAIIFRVKRFSAAYRRWIACELHCTPNSTWSIYGVEKIGKQGKTIAIAQYNEFFPESFNTAEKIPTAFKSAYFVINTSFFANAYNISIMIHRDVVAKLFWIYIKLNQSVSIIYS